MRALRCEPLYFMTTSVVWAIQGLWEKVVRLGQDSDEGLGRGRVGQ